MADSILGSLCRVVCYIIFVIFVIATLLFLYTTMTVASYQSQVHTIITRSGGLTRHAYIDCNELSQTHYQGHFHVSTQDNLGAKADDDGYWSHSNDDAKAGHDTDSNYTKTPDEAFGQIHGKQSQYYLYLNIPFHPPFWSRGNFHTSKKPLQQNYQSGIRSGSQQ